MIPPRTGPLLSEPPPAYAAVSDFVRRRSRTFRLITSFLPREKRQVAWVVYAFFRTLDDLVDQQAITLSEFRTWRRQTMRAAGGQLSPILAAWADIRERYGLDPRHVEDLLDGIEMDLSRRRYETLDQLSGYCYRVAAAGALLALPVMGLRPGRALTQAEPYVVKLSLAVQLTDILCDVDDDLQAGRIYLPRTELAAFDLSYADIEARTPDERFQHLMRHLVQEARRLYVAGWPALAFFSGLERLAAGFAALLFRAHLGELERMNFDVFGRRVHFSTLRKLGLLFRYWPAIAWPEHNLLAYHQP